MGQEGKNERRMREGRGEYEDVYLRAFSFDNPMLPCVIQT